MITVLTGAAAPAVCCRDRWEGKNDFVRMTVSQTVIYLNWSRVWIEPSPGLCPERGLPFGDACSTGRI